MDGNLDGINDVRRARRAAKRALALSIALAWSERPAAADVVELAAIEQRAALESPRLIAARERAAAAHARARSAGVLEDPTLSVDAMDVIPSGGRPLELWTVVRQPLPAPGKRGAARAVAESETALADAQLAAEERAFLGELRGAWAELWQAQEERKLLMEAHEVVELLVATANARYGGGKEDAVAPLMARLALRRHELEQQAADARWLELQSTLAELAGGASGVAFSRVAPPPEQPFPEVEIAAAAALSPAVVVAERRVARAEAELAAARLGLRPDWSVGGGVRTIDGDGSEAILSLGVELPFFRHRRQQPLVEAAESELRAARADADAARLAAKAELQRRFLERARIDLQLAHVEQGVLPESSAAFEAARASLINGSGSVERAAQLLADWIEAKLDRVRFVAQRFANRAAVVALLPDDPKPAAGGDR